ncbi:MAG: methyltransferase [Myxococcales bacterium]|nr:methyltransferase [Myxococcales bacterium]
MIFGPNFAERLFVPELMDDPHCDAETLSRTYRDLAFINATLSRMKALLVRYVLDDVATPGHAAHVVEVGCGGGDVLAWLAAEAQRRGLSLALTGVDSDARALAAARGRLERAPGVQVADVPLTELASLRPDYVFCNHVLHHVAPNEVGEVLVTMQKACRRRLLVNDLHRSRFAYASYTVLAAALFRKSFAYHDGRLSIRKGFLPEELRTIAAHAGLPSQTQVGTLFPGRVFLVSPGGAP